MQGTTFGGWRVLAETTYGVTEFGRALRLEPGTRLRPYAAKGVDAETGCGVTVLPGAETVLVGPDGATELVYVKAGLRLTDSTAPWDQPRRATTVTLRRSGARTASEEELVAQIELESPHMSEVEIDFVNWRKDGEVCCLISWRNPALRFEGDPKPKARWADVEAFMLTQPQAMPADPLGPVPGSGQARAKTRRRRA